MKKNETKMNNKGFSLVELIVVIAIMAVLVGVLAPQFMKYIERSRQGTDVQNIEEVASALQVYFAIDESGTGIYSVTLTTSGVDAGSDSEAKEALADAGLSSVKLKSSNWKQGTGTSAADGVKVEIDLSTGQIKKTGVNKYFNADGTRVTSTPATPATP